jgi:hypothetical protein
MDTVLLQTSNSDVIEVTTQSCDTIEIIFYDQLNIGVAMELTVDILIGDNVIAHTLGRKVSFLTAFFENRLLALDWTNVDPNTSQESDNNIYIPSSPAEYTNVKIYII